jgi:hypothetical protein
MSAKKHHKQKKQTTLSSDIKGIYTDESGALPDMTKLEHSSRFAWGRFLLGAGVLAVLTITAWAGFFFFSSGPNFSSTQVDIRVQAPFTIASGEPFSYDITIANNEETALENGEISFKLPQEFILIESSPTLMQEQGFFNATPNVYTHDIDYLPARKDYTLRINGYLVGEDGFVPTLTIRYTYSPESSSSTFEKNSSFTNEIQDTAISLTASYPQQITYGNTFVLTFEVTNTNSDTSLEDIELHLESPESFKLTSVQQAGRETSESEERAFSPLAEIDQDIFNADGYIPIAALPADGMLQYRVEGIFTESAHEEPPLALRVTMKDTKVYTTQVREEITPRIVKNELIPILRINDQEEDHTINFGEDLTYTLRLENKSPSALGDIRVRAVLDSDMLTSADLAAATEGTVNGNQILWTEDTIEELKLLVPEDTLEIEFTIPTPLYTEIRNAQSKDLSVRSFFEVTVGRVDNLDIVSTTESDVLTTFFNSNTALTTQARYFDTSGTAVGSGPHPPQANTPTIYEVVWNVENSINEISDIVIITSLPKNVSWEGDGETDAGTLSFENGAIQWSVNKLPTSITSLTARFKVTVTPTQADINTLLTLINPTTLTAQDTVTQGTIKLTHPALNTSNIDESSGLVQE